MALLTPAFAVMAHTGTPSYPRSAKSSVAAASSASRVAAASRRQSRRLRVARVLSIVRFVRISTNRLVNSSATPGLLSRVTHPPSRLGDQPALGRADVLAAADQTAFRSA